MMNVTVAHFYYYLFSMLLYFFLFFFVLSFLLKSTWLVFSSSAVSSNFWGYRCATGESGRRGGRWKPSPVGSRGKTPENFSYFVFWIAQNIALVKLRQRTMAKAHTRNQHFWEFGGLSLGFQTGTLASK